ncbi:MAG: CSLREA domain-containing protein [Deltaproteobacteria bacterium]|nr:CSLREA domain-containing protein [Deltaproteobacteria bacterium]
MSAWRLALLVAASLAVVPLSDAAVFAVTKTTDSADGQCDADCSLREAILAANQLQDTSNRIDLAPGTYRLSIPRDPERFGNGLGTGADGNLVVSRTLTIAGAGRDTTVIDARPAPEAASVDRVLAVAQSGHLTLGDVTITGGRAGEFAQGGGIVVLGGTLAIHDCRVSGNVALGGGGGIALGGASANPPAMATITRCEIAGNVAGSEALGAQGGGLLDIQATMTVVESTIRDNVALFSTGGGIMNIDNQSRPNPAAELTVERSTIVGNLAGDPAGLSIFEGVGGGIYNAGGLLRLTNSTVTGNEAVASFAEGLGQIAGTGRGGGVAHALLAGDDASDGTFIVASTIAYNTAPTGSQIYGEAQVNPAQLANTLIAGGAGASANCASPSGQVGIASVGGGNLSDDASPCGLGLPGDQSGVGDPGLADALADNGGPTETIALLEGSPAIGAGYVPSCPQRDQRGYTRRSPCDVGAFETVPEPGAAAASLAAVGTLELLRRRAGRAG